ncbi:MAG TPA: NAD(P)-binding domain-containing protein [Gemmatimonadaceae bacterium]|nr:NAD(P)-binding domain-containing protein [Gemmatimonadaceae bacterium]
MSEEGRLEIDPVPGARQASAVARHEDRERTGVVVVGAGPCGLAAGIALKKAGIPAVLLERGCLVSGIYGYPTFMTFFSTAERLSIGGVPFSVATEKPTRRDALAYYRTVTEHFALDVRQYEGVERIERIDDTAAGDARGAPPDSTIAAPSPADGTEPSPAIPESPARLPVRFRVHSRTRAGRARLTEAHAVVVATGYFGHPNRLGVPGETLPHVTHLFEEGHVAYDLPVVVVGGGNSAVDAALDLYRAGARVTLVHFAPQLDRNVKPWVMPDIVNRIKEGSIAAKFDSRVVEIDPEFVVLATPRGEERVRAEQVYLMLGYQPNNELLRQLAVPIDATTGIPTHDPATMETAVPGVFMAGVLASGYDANKTFIENGRHHGELIAAALAERLRH